MRLSPELDEYVRLTAKRTKRSRGAIIESLAEEAARCRMFPGIGFKGPEHDRRAWVTGTGLDVWEIVQLVQDFGTVEKVCADLNVHEPQVRLALAYYERFPKEIDDAITLNRTPLEDLRKLYPYPVFYVRD